MNTKPTICQQRRSDRQRGAVPPWVLLALLVMILLAPLPRLGHLHESFTHAPLILFALVFIALFIVLPIVLLVVRSSHKNKNADHAKK